MKLFRNVRDIAKKVGEKISGISDTTTLRDIGVVSDNWIFSERCVILLIFGE